jgi:hypothetical protein
VRQRRQTEGFNLAFLDIMSCGLGAIVLVFMLVKHNVDNSVVETDLLEAELTQLEDTQARLRQSIVETKGRIGDQQKEISSATSEKSRIENRVSEQRQSFADKMKRLSELKKSIESTVPSKPQDVVEKQGIGEENYVMGLKVEGRKIAILVDASASMTDDLLINVIRRKNASAAEKQKGPKWIRTIEIVRWLLARLPKKNTSVKVVAFNERAIPLGGNAWHSSRSPNIQSAIVRDLQKLVPSGATNLQRGLKSISRDGATNVYLITDGLPTAGDSRYRSLNPFASCSSLTGSSHTISGDCRVKLFRQSVLESGPGSAVTVNVILLPLDGDPEASPEYWGWTAKTGGLLISPAVSWP